MVGRKTRRAQGWTTGISVIAPVLSRHPTLGQPQTNLLFQFDHR
jgi:hypothetical protein